MKLDQPSVNVGSTKCHNSWNTNRSRLAKDSNVPFSYKKEPTQNEFKYFAIGTWVTLFVMKNMEFNEKVVDIESPIKYSGWHNVDLHSSLPATS